ncbi:MAG: YggS family pyridoxal phosphate-dependent enzyme [Gordonia sp. (in: high G+C Gram-positive bacteria)]
MGADPTVAGDLRTAELAARLAAVRARLATAVAAAGREPGEVELLVVTKFFPAADVIRLIGLGERSFGESREPEAGRKIAEVRTNPAVARLGAATSFDMIGSVQTKKVKTVARWSRAVHSVDREKLVVQLSSAAAAALDAGERSAPLRVYLQVSLDGDPARGGVGEAGLAALADTVESSESLELAGLMVIAPLRGSSQQNTSQYWMDQAQRIHHAFRENYPQAVGLSAGMSGDLDTAVAHGSTCVRVGTAILGQRPLLSR